MKMNKETIEILIAIEKIEVGDYLVIENRHAVRKWKEGDPLNEAQKQRRANWKNQTGIFK